MQRRGSRFAYAINFVNNDQRWTGTERADSIKHKERSFSGDRRVKSPQGYIETDAITGPSTQQNYDSQILTCFGNPTLETLNIKNEIPTFDHHLKVKAFKQKNKKLGNDINVSKHLSNRRKMSTQY